MKSRYKIKVFNATLVLTLYVLLGMYSCAQAQAIQRICQTGYEVSYGLHDFKMRTVGEHAGKFSPGARGIALGGFLGNNLLKLRVRGLGFYESNKLFKDEYYQYEAEVLSNFAPLEFFRVRKNVVDIYVITGFNFSQIHLGNHFSTYGKKRFDRLSRVAGVGMEYIIRKGKKTICIFSDATVAHKLTESTGKDGNTPFPAIQSALNVGVRVGYSKSIKLKPGF